MTEYSIPKEINDFYSSVANQSLIRKVERTTFFDIINKSRREDVHSNFLKWVFMLDKLPCPDALMPVNNLLRIIIRRAIEQNKENELPDIILEDILCGSATVRVTDVKREAKGAAEEALSSLKTLKSRQVYQITTPRNPQPKDVDGHTKMVTFVVKDYAETHSQRDVEDAFNGKGIRNNLEVIYNEGNLPKDKSRYSQEKIKCSGGKSIWCTNQWIPVVADRFIAEAESLGYTIKKL